MILPDRNRSNQEIEYHMLNRAPANETPDKGVRFEAVALRRGASMLFAGLTLELTEARIGLIGDNGSGKSSFLRLINGLLLPDAGQVLVCGLESRSNRKLLPGKAGFLFQNPDHQILFPTVAEEICFGLREGGLAPPAAEARMRRILADHHCADWEHRPVHELSDGQKQRLCLLAVIAMEPEILLLDEPFSSLDYPTRRYMAAELMRMPQQIIMASHDFELLAGFDRILWLDNGEIAGDGEPGPILSRYKSHAHARVEPAGAP